MVAVNIVNVKKKMITLIHFLFIPVILLFSVLFKIKYDFRLEYSQAFYIKSTYIKTNCLQYNK